MVKSNMELGAFSSACRDAYELISLEHDVAQAIRIASLERCFVSLGEIPLGDEGTLVFAGFKSRSFSSERVAKEMLIGDKLLKSKPERVNSLPLFNIPIVTDTGFELGILTEDFTQNGAKQLVERRLALPKNSLWFSEEHVPEGLNKDVFNALDKVVYTEAFSHMTGRVGGDEVMVDFDDVATPKSHETDAYNRFAESIALVIKD